MNGTACKARTSITKCATYSAKADTCEKCEVSHYLATDKKSCKARTKLSWSSVCLK